MPRNVKCITAQDLKAVELIRSCGHAREENGRACLESNSQISPWRWHRLKELGLVVANMDGLLFGETQTWRVA